MSQAKVNSITDQAGTGAPDFPNGLTVDPTSLTDAAATKLGLKEYTDSEVAVTVTGVSTVSSVTVEDARFIPYQLSSGNWRLKFNFNLSTITSTGSFTGRDVVNIGGITGIMSQAISVVSDSEVTHAFVRTNGNISTGWDVVKDTNGFSFFYSGDVALASKPTWAV